jgi:hypothetical protein
LKAAALRLAQAVQSNPQKATADAVAAISDEQRRVFATVQAAEAPGDAIDDPDKAKAEEILDQHPLQMPVVVGGVLYRAGIGHATIGWRTYADWSVTFESIEKSGIGKATTIVVGMHKGKLIATTFD